MQSPAKAAELVREVEAARTLDLEAVARCPPPAAASGGPLAFWVAMLAALAGPLAVLGEALAGRPLEEILFPHPTSGPLDARQRLEFLRFHLDRHRGQAERVLAGL